MGNICRSPIGEGLFKRRAEELGRSVDIHSAGIGALVGHPADPFAIEVAAEHGLDLNAHRAQQLNEQLIRTHELILVMETGHVKEIETLYPFARGRVHLIGKWSGVEVPDPYRKPKESFIDVFHTLEKTTEEWCKKLW